MKSVFVFVTVLSVVSLTVWIAGACQIHCKNHEAEEPVCGTNGTDVQTFKNICFLLLTRCDEIMKLILGYDPVYNKVSDGPCPTIDNQAT